MSNNDEYFKFLLIEHNSYNTIIIIIQSCNNICKVNVIKTYLIEVLHDILDDITACFQVGTDSDHTIHMNVFVLIDFNDE